MPGQPRRNHLSREERQAFWSAIIEDEDAPLRDRLKASELLARSDGDFEGASDSDTWTIEDVRTCNAVADKLRNAG